MSCGKKKARIKLGFWLSERLYEVRLTETVLERIRASLGTKAVLERFQNGSGGVPGWYQNSTSTDPERLQNSSGPKTEDRAHLACPT